MEKVATKAARLASSGVAALVPVAAMAQPADKPNDSAL